MGIEYLYVCSKKATFSRCSFKALDATRFNNMMQYGGDRNMTYCVVKLHSTHLYPPLNLHYWNCDTFLSMEFSRL